MTANREFHILIDLIDELTDPYMAKVIDRDDRIRIVRKAHEALLALDEASMQTLRDDMARDDAEARRTDKGRSLRSLLDDLNDLDQPDRQPDGNTDD